MAWRRSLRARFLTASALLVITGTIAGAWSLIALSRLSASMAAIVHGNDRLTAATARLSGALEREDDALLLVVAGDARGREILARNRALTGSALEGLGDDREVTGAVTRYREAADRAIALPLDRDVLLVYHREVNPLLRAAVASIGAIRDRHFTESQAAAARARDEARRARDIALAVVAAALAVSVLVALRLARAVIGPLATLRKSAVAIQRGASDVRADVPSGDELGDVAASFNAMATHLDEFRRSNLTEVLQAKASLEATLAALPDAVALVEADGHIAALNGEAESLLRDVGHAGWRDVAALAPLGITAAQIATPPQATLALDAAVRVDRPSGPRHLLPRIFPVETGEGGGGGGGGRVVVVISDVTELVRLDRLRAEMVAVASHELRTPVTTLRMTLGMLRERSSDLAPAMKELITTALSGVGQLTETVDELLDLTRVEAGELRLAFEPVDLAQLVRDAAPRWRTRAADKGLRVEIETSAPALVRADRGRFRVVLDNLIDNAIKYSPPGGRIDVSLSVAGGSVALSVTDEGPGVPPELRARIFEKFFRVEDHQRRQGDAPHGTGIGLYLCRALVEMHGGTIACVAPPHTGTRIEVALPASMQNAVA